MIPQQASKPGRTDLGRETNRFQITEEYHGTDIQLEAVDGKALGTSDHNFIVFKKAFDRFWDKAAGES